MKKIVVMLLLLAAFTTGCSYHVTSSSSQSYRGESENWKADYKADFRTSFQEKAGKTYVTKKEKDHLTITYKNDVTLLVPARHFEMTFNDINGNKCKQTEDSDSPFVKKEFHSGGGMKSTIELNDPLQTQGNLHKSIMIYSGPSYEMRTNASITVNIKIDGKSENMILKPDMDISPAEAFKIQIGERLKQMWIEKRYPEFAETYEEQEL